MPTSAAPLSSMTVEFSRFFGGSWLLLFEGLLQLQAEFIIQGLATLTPLRRAIPGSVKPPPRRSQPDYRPRQLQRHRPCPHLDSRRLRSPLGPRLEQGLAPLWSVAAALTAPPWPWLHLGPGT